MQAQKVVGLQQQVDDQEKEVRKQRDAVKDREREVEKQKEQEDVEKEKAGEFETAA